MPDEAAQKISEDHPLAVAWKAFKETEDFANAKKWAAIEQHADGALWHVFLKAFIAGAGAEHARCKDIVDKQRQKAQASTNIASLATVKAILAAINRLN